MILDEKTTVKVENIFSGPIKSQPPNSASCSMQQCTNSNNKAKHSSSNSSPITKCSLAEGNNKLTPHNISNSNKTQQADSSIDASQKSSCSNSSDGQPFNSDTSKDSSSSVKRANSKSTGSRSQCGDEDKMDCEEYTEMLPNSVYSKRNHSDIMEAEHSEMKDDSINNKTNSDGVSSCGSDIIDDNTSQSNVAKKEETRIENKADTTCISNNSNSDGTTDGNIASGDDSSNGTTENNDNVVQWSQAEFLRFRNKLFEIMEELRIKRDEVTSEKTHLVSQHAEEMEVLQQKNRASLKTLEEEKAKLKMHMHCNESEKKSLKDDVRVLKFMKYNLEKKTQEQERQLCLWRNTKDGSLAQIQELEKKTRMFTQDVKKVMEVQERLELNGPAVFTMLGPIVPSPPVRNLI
ncbi:putative uncharacterized protein DDB_G0274535 [Lingula anatina]|uniref:Uncharacterized protein n=1 Tax=Lingula anatina TaxID=7574 RepID=A0A1S3IR72_LINAN|nr:putative uncharacterized protein DDB_G0274535 [Lingula anatina]|eukprot:XP_013400710.1 putative uncharacterized protein DDB_G0274535 [Lingula anatina]